LIIPPGFPRWSLCERAKSGTRGPPGGKIGKNRKSQSSLFSVVSTPAGFIGFHTVTENSGSAGGTNHRDGVEAGAVAGS
jgi:hypothetical protein